MKCGLDSKADADYKGVNGVSQVLHSLCLNGNSFLEGDYEVCITMSSLWTEPSTTLSELNLFVYNRIYISYPWSCT